MTSAKSLGKPVRAVLWVACVCVVVFAVGIALYAVRVQASANALISAAQQIRTTADAERVIATWKRRGGQSFWLESDHHGGDHNYDGQVDNLPLSRLGLVKPTNMVFSVTTKGGKLRCITLAMYTEAHRNSPSGVWIQEWFDSDEPKRPRVSTKDKPSKAAVEFTSATADRDREQAFALNTKCFVLPHGCRTAEDILPAVWQLDATLKLAFQPVPVVAASGAKRLVRNAGCRALRFQGCGF